MTLRHSIVLPMLFALGAVLLSACQDRSAGNSGTTAHGPADPAPEAKLELAVGAGRLILPVLPDNPGAAYFTLSNAGKHSASVARISIKGAGKAEMHQTLEGQMKGVDLVDISPGTTREFAPGGLHVMVFRINPQLKPGDSVEMTITFADGDKLSAPLQVIAAGLGGGGIDHADKKYAGDKIIRKEQPVKYHEKMDHNGMNHQSMEKIND